MPNFKVGQTIFFKEDHSVWIVMDVVVSKDFFQYNLKCEETQICTGLLPASEYVEAMFYVKFNYNKYWVELNK